MMDHLKQVGPIQSLVLALACDTTTPPAVCMQNSTWSSKRSKQTTSLFRQLSTYICIQSAATSLTYCTTSGVTSSPSSTSCVHLA